MTTIQDVLSVKGSEVFTIQREETVFRAVELMAEKNTGSLVVMDGESVCGIITERDYVRKIALAGRSSRTTPVHEIMTSRVCIAQPEDEIEHSLAVMTQKRCRHLPVVDSEGLMGLVSIGDLVKKLVDDRETEIRHLHDYIQGKYPG